MPKVSLDFNTRKDIKVIMLKGERGQSSYQEAVENLLFSGTLEEWIETFATPENYITRTEFQKVTQAQYDELKAQGRLIPNAFYLIIDDPTYAELLSAIDDLGGTNGRVTILETTVGTLETTVETLGTNVGDLSAQLNSLGGRVTDLENKRRYQHTVVYTDTINMDLGVFDIKVIFNFFSDTNVPVSSYNDFEMQLEEQKPYLATGYKKLYIASQFQGKNQAEFVVYENGDVNVYYDDDVVIDIKPTGYLQDAVTRIV